MGIPTAADRSMRMLRMLRRQGSGFSSMKLKALLMFAGFSFRGDTEGRLYAEHPNHPAILPLRLSLKPMQPFVARRLLDIVEEVLSVRESEESSQ